MLKASFKKTGLRSDGLLGRYVTFGEKNEPAILRAVGMDQQGIFSAVLERVDSFGRPAGGPLVFDFLAALHFEPIKR